MGNFFILNFSGDRNFSVTKLLCLLLWTEWTFQSQALLDATPLICRALLLYGLHVRHFSGINQN